MKRLSLALFGLLANVGVADAAAIADTTLASPGVYFGSGNVNAHFSVDRTGSVETGLGVVERFVGPIDPLGTTTYNVSTGPTSEPGKTGADWGIVFSLNLNADGNGTATLADQITLRLSLTDVGNNTFGSFDTLIIPDNSLYGAGGPCTPAASCGPSSNYYAVQNSEALSFSIIASLLGDPAYDLNANNTYIFDLEAYQNGTNLLSKTRATVIAGLGATPVPEPLTVSLFGTGFAAMALMRRRKKLKTA